MNNWTNKQMAVLECDVRIIRLALLTVLTQSSDRNAILGALQTHVLSLSNDNRQKPAADHSALFESRVHSFASDLESLRTKPKDPGPRPVR